jgi:hypothetical protein
LLYCWSAQLAQCIATADTCRKKEKQKQNSEKTKTEKAKKHHKIKH